MKIGLHDADGEGFKFPNLALMKLSAWHKAQGDRVEWWDAVTEHEPSLKCDKVYSSKVFTFTDECHYLPKDVIKGGTGYGIYKDLPEEIDGIFPDYSIYPHVDYAIGFLTRGCPNKCPWCVVPRKEGEIRPYQTAWAIKRPNSDKIVFMDNNVLASSHGLEQIDRLGETRIKVDFNQGLDARLITPKIAELLGRLHWLSPLRMACDQKSQMSYIEQAVAYLRENNCTPKRYSCYVLVKDIADALERVEFLRALNVDPFAQPYRDFENKIEPTEEQRHFARWVNRKEIFKTVKWEDYK